MGIATIEVSFYTKGKDELSMLGEENPSDRERTLILSVRPVDRHKEYEKIYGRFKN